MPVGNFLVIVMNDDQRKALEILAEKQSKTPAEMAETIIREQLVSYGLMKWEPTPDQMKLKVFQTAGDLSGNHADQTREER